MSGQQDVFNATHFATKSPQEKYAIVLAELQNTTDGGKNWNQWQLQTLTELLKTGADFEALFAGLLIRWAEPGPIQTVLIKSLYQLSDAEFKKIAELTSIKRWFFDLNLLNNREFLLGDQIEITQIHEWQKETLRRMINEISDTTYQALDKSKKSKLDKLFMQLNAPDDLLGIPTPTDAQYPTLPQWVQKAWVGLLIHHEYFMELGYFPKSGLLSQHIAEFYRKALLEENQGLADKLAAHLAPSDVKMCKANVQPEIDRRLAEAQRRAKEEAERRAKEEAERLAKEEAERRAEEQRLAKEEAERRAKEEAERRAKEEAERRAKEEAERRAKEEAEQRAKEEAEQRAKEEAEQRAKEEADRRSAAPTPEAAPKPSTASKLWTAIKNAWQRFKAWIGKKLSRSKPSEDVEDQSISRDETVQSRQSSSRSSVKAPDNLRRPPSVTSSLKDYEIVSPDSANPEGAEVRPRSGSRNSM